MDLEVSPSVTAYGEFLRRKRNAARKDRICEPAAPGWGCWFSSKHPVHEQKEWPYVWIIE